MTTSTIAHPPGRLVDLGDTQLWIETEGEGEPLLLLSGGPASSHLVFHPYFSELNDHQVIYVDYRGRGRSAPVADPSEVTFIGDVADIAALIRALGLGAVNVYGFSYGGMVAQALALDHPDLVKRLILANTLHSPEMWQKNHENINREIEMQYPEVWEQILALRSEGVRSTDPRVQDLYRVHSKLIRFYNPDNAARLLSEPGSKNAELYPVFVGDDVEFFIGGEVAKLPDFRPRLEELPHAGPHPRRPLRPRALSEVSMGFQALRPPGGIHLDGAKRYVLSRGGAGGGPRARAAVCGCRYGLGSQLITHWYSMYPSIFHLPSGAM